MGPRVRVAIAILASAACLTACGDNGFEPFFSISKLRALGVQIEPPELGPDETATITMLQASVDEEPILTRWELCLFLQGPDEFYECQPIDEAGSDGIMDLGEGSEVQVSYDEIIDTMFFGEPSAVSVLCDLAGSTEVPDFVELPTCELGVPLSLRAVSTQGAEEEVVVRSFTLLLEENATRDDRNINPTIDGIGLAPPPDEPDAEPSPLAADGTSIVILSSEGEMPLELLIDVAHAEAYTPVDGSEATIEDLQATWFSSVGAFDLGNTYYRQPVAPEDEFISNTLMFEVADFEGETAIPVDLWVVVRDTRGGIAMLEISVIAQLPE